MKTIAQLEKALFANVNLPALRRIAVVAVVVTALVMVAGCGVGPKPKEAVGATISACLQPPSRSH